MALSCKKIFAVIMILFLSFFVTNYSYAIGEKQKIKTIEQQRREMQKKIDSLKKLERKEANKLSLNQQKLEKNQQALKRSTNQLSIKQANITHLKKELNTYLNQYNTRQSSSAERIRCIYKSKHSPILDILVSTENLSDFLDRIYYQNLIIKSDRERMFELRAEAKKVATAKQRLESEQRELSKIIRDINKENSNIQVTIKQNKSIIEKIQKDKRAYEKSERELKRQSDHLASLIYKTTRNSDISTSGAFMLPVSGARVTSPFGYRIHPIFKSRIFHTGIDYGIASGTPIRASNSGKVIYSGWYGGYGKVVIIDHGIYKGQQTSTLYAHMSRQAVSVGQSVSKGQVIGYVGSTGYSTGPHVHFEVRINGKPQNPNNFL